MGCDPSARTENGETLISLDDEEGPVLKYCQSIQLNSKFTDADMRQGGITIVKYQSCDLGGHEFVFNVTQSGTYIFISRMSFNGVLYDLKLNVDVDSGTNAKCEMPILLEPFTGIPSRVRSFVFGDSVKELVATSIGTIVIQGVDALQFPRTAGSLDLSVSISSIYLSGQAQADLKQGQNAFWELVNNNNGMYTLYFRVNVQCTILVSVFVQDPPPTEGKPLPPIRKLLEPKIVILPGAKKNALLHFEIPC
jgi:hypothetical protein